MVRILITTNNCNGVMEQPRSLIIITKTYPFDVGEEFIENELPILADYFDKIVILATAVPFNSKQTRSLPDGVTTVVIHESRTTLGKYARCLFRGLPYALSCDLRNELLSSGSFKAYIGALYLKGRSIALERAAESRLRKEISSSENVVIYSYWFLDLPLLSIELKNKLFKTQNIHIISRAHGYDLYDYRSILGVIPFRKKVLSVIDKVFPCSKNGELYLKDKFPEYSNKIETSYLGTRDYGFGVQSRKAGMKLVTCSSVISIKRLNIVAEAIHLLIKDGHKVEWTCIGDGPLFGELHKQVQALGINDKVQFKGRMNNTDIMRLYQHEAFDVFLNVSETEGLPVSIMEAISFGIPVLATDVGGTNEIVKNDITGILLPADITADQLKSAILRIFELNMNRKTIRQFWLENFNSETNYKLFARRVNDLSSRR